MNEKTKEILIKAAIFFGVFMFIIGVGCSLGWIINAKEWFAMVCDFVVIGFAIPTFVKLFKMLLS